MRDRGWVRADHRAFKYKTKINTLEKHRKKPGTVFTTICFKGVKVGRQRSRLGLFAVIYVRSNHVSGYSNGRLKVKSTESSRNKV